MLILRRGAPIVSLTTLLLIGAALVLSHRQQALYEATRLVRINPNNIDPSSSLQAKIDNQVVLETEALTTARTDAVITTDARRQARRPRRSASSCAAPRSPPTPRRTS